MLNVFANKRKRMDSLRRVREREARRPAMGKRLRAVMDGVSLAEPAVVQWRSRRRIR